MSVVAKILVVLNLVLAIAFLGAAATFLGAKESYKKQFEDLQVSSAKVIDTLKDNEASANKRYNEQRVAAEKAAGEREAAIESMKLQEAQALKVTETYNKLLGDHNKLAKTYDDAIANNKSQSADIARLNGEKEQAIAEKAAAVKTANDAVTEQRRLKAASDDQNDTIASLEKTINKMAAQIEQLDLTVSAYKERVGDLGGILSMKAVKAKVSSVSGKFNIVMLSVGSDDGVQAGYEFTIYRGRNYVGRVVIDRVEKDHCSGYSKKEIETSPIKAGDDARTRF